MQTKLNIFDNTPTYGEIVCKRIIELCDKKDMKPRINYNMYNIKKVMKT